MTDNNEDIFTTDSDPTKTVDMSAKNAIEVLKGFTGPPDELAVLLEGEGRKTVLEAAERGPTPEASDSAEPYIDPEIDRENWPSIQLAHEDGKPNYAYLGVSGTHLDKDGKTWIPFTHAFQVRRGDIIQVPPSIVGMLQTTIETRFEQETDPVSGRIEMKRYDRPGIPWQLIKPGKYC